MDFSDIQHGYKTAWAYRKMVARLMLPALIAHFACFAVATYVDASIGKLSIISVTLIFLPALFAQGSMASLLARFSLMGMRGLEVNRHTIKQIMAGTVVYILITVFCHKIFIN